MEKGGRTFGPQCHRRAAPGAREAAARAVQVLASIDISPLMSQQQQLAVLVSGSLLMAGWRFISLRLQGFEARGMSSLAEVWLVVVAAFGAGQLARLMAKAAPVAGLVADLAPAAPAAAAAPSSSKAGQPPQQQEKEGREDGAVVEPPAAQPPCGEEDEDDVGVQKRIAQAEAAAKLAQYQSSLRQLLSGIGQSGSVADDAAALFRLADQLFASPIHLHELVSQGGVPVLLRVLRSAAGSLEEQQAGGGQEGGVLPSMLQVSWVLLQIAHGPPACRASLAAEAPAQALLQAMRAVVAAQPRHAEAKEAVLRNLGWTALMLCDASWVGTASGDGGALACAAALHANGAVPLLQRLASGEFGVGPGWVASATLALFVQPGEQQQQQQQAHQLQQLQQAAVDAALQVESLHGLCYMLQRQPQLSDRLRGLVHNQVHYLLSRHAPELLRLLVQEHLVGSLAASVPQKIGRLLVCQLLSSRGQEVMAAVEADFELDVPLALAQVIPLPVHLKLPAAPAQQQQQQQHEVGEPAEPAEAPEAAAEDVYTDVLACRLLLQHSRLDELLSAFAEEQAAEAAAAGQEGAGEGQPSAVVAAVLALMRFLMARDLELQAVRHERGGSVDDSQSCGAASASLASSASSAMDAALAAPDPSGVYSQVLSGMVPGGRLPAAAAARDDGQELLVLPPPPAGAPAAAAALRAGHRAVVFQFGALSHAVDRRMYRQISGASKLVHSVLAREAPAPGEPVTVLATPHFTDAANLWVLLCLERWLATGALEGFSAAQAAKLWVAADFLQVDGLQVACEDVVIGAAAADARHADVALELCARHRGSSGRLLRLAAQLLMRNLLRGADGDQQQQQQQQDLQQQQQDLQQQQQDLQQQQQDLQQGAACAKPHQPHDGAAHLRSLLALHGDVLLPALHAEARDRLVTLCMLNVGVDDDTPGDFVG